MRGKETEQWRGRKERSGEPFIRYVCTQAERESEREEERGSHKLRERNELYNISIEF